MIALDSFPTDLETDSTSSSTSSRPPSGPTYQAQFMDLWDKTYTGNQRPRA